MSRITDTKWDELVRTRVSLSLREYGELEGWSAAAVRERMRRGTLPVRPVQSRPGSEWRVPISEIVRVAEGGVADE